ncbi:MAG: hypothetical protein ABR599_09285 [Gemmatimonadota bacterium]
MSPSVLHVRDLEWVPEDDPAAGSFFTRSAAVASRLGARKLGYHLRELPPGRALCPYHAHRVNDELFLVTQGARSVRFAEGSTGSGWATSWGSPRGRRAFTSS